MVDAPKTLATVREYVDLVEALRARRDALQITHETIDAVSGLAAGYTGKLLAPPTGPTDAMRPSKRHLGPLSFGPMLAALGLKLLVVEDKEAIARVRSRLVLRKPNGQRAHMAPLDCRRRPPARLEAPAPPSSPP